MKEPRSEFKIGLTVLLALAILIASILWGKQFYFTTGTYKVDVRFQDIAGLDQGVSVLVNGVHRGKVSDLILLREGVIVRLAIQKSVILHNDARFEIVSPELMGGKVVNVFPGISGVQPPDGFIYEGKVGGDMNELMRRSADLVEDVKGLLVALEMTAENINKTAGDPRLQEALLSSVRNFDESSQRTLEFLTLNEGKLTEVMDNLVVSTEAIRELVENRADDIHEAVVDFDLFVSQLNELAFKLDQVITQLQSTEGTLGILLNDDELAVTLERTLVDLDSLVRQIKEEGIETNIHLFGRRR